MDSVPFNKPFVVGRELYYIAQSVVEGHLSGDGRFSKLCNKWLEEKLGVTKAFLTHSCSGALDMSAILINIKPGDEVIMPSYGFVSAANAFVLRGGIPVFVDIRPDTLNIDEELIEQAITPKTRGIIPVHYAGVGCEMNAITEIAGNHDLVIIEDAAQALLSTYKGQHLGSFGDIACISFHETKNCISGEGGAILINDPGLVERAEVIREKGTNRPQFFRNEIDKYTWIDVGSSFLPSELIGAFLWAQLEQAEQIVQRRRDLFDRYSVGLKSLSTQLGLSIPGIPEHCQGNAHMFYLITRSRDERLALLHFLNNNGVDAVFHYIPLHSSPAGMKFGRTQGSMHVTDSLSSRIVRMPIFYDMTLDMVDSVVDLVHTFYQHRV
jgi:dTDP-4-amino-4,6-dideoxygalactose transaminase